MGEGGFLVWDFDGTLAMLLRGTGAAKPHAQAFEVVFATYPEARKGWMIGDNWRADVQGALAREECARFSCALITPTPRCGATR